MWRMMTHGRDEQQRPLAGLPRRTSTCPRIPIPLLPCRKKGADFRRFVHYLRTVSVQFHPVWRLQSGFCHCGAVDRGLLRGLSEVLRLRPERLRHHAASAEPDYHAGLRPKRRCFCQAGDGLLSAGQRQSGPVSDGESEPTGHRRHRFPAGCLSCHVCHGHRQNGAGLSGAGPFPAWRQSRHQKGRLGTAGSCDRGADSRHPDPHADVRRCGI